MSEQVYKIQFAISKAKLEELYRDWAILAGTVFASKSAAEIKIV